MTESRDSGAWQTTRDHDEIRKWAERHDAVPVDRGADAPQPGFEREPAEGVGWERFFEVFDGEEFVFRYRRSDDDDDTVMPDYEILRRRELETGGEPEDQTYEPEEVDSEQRALSDTGDAEPVAFERTERAGAEDTDTAANTRTGDETSGPTQAADRLVLDAVHEHRPGLGDSQDEHVSLENAGEEPIDISGWELLNGAARSFTFPEGTVLDPGERVRVHSGHGSGGDNEFYWDADGVVWRARGDTVVVETPDGRRALREDYKGGRSEPG